VLNQEKQPSFSNRHTNWDDWTCIINERLNLNISLKTEEDTEAAVKFLQQYNTMGRLGCNPRTYSHCPILIKQKIEEKRRLRRDWH
jgi:hypothetical protein